MFRPIWWMMPLLVFGLFVPAQAEESASAPLARELTALLEQHEIDSAAAPMPGEPDRFVAAIYYANSQLFVVSARYPAPSLLQEQIGNHKYHDVYTALHRGGQRDGKVFVLDLGANGFAPMGDENGQIDVIYEDGVTQTTLDGDWRGQKLSKTEYRKRLVAADARYAKMLDALIDELNAST